MNTLIMRRFINSGLQVILIAAFGCAPPPTPVEIRLPTAAPTTPPTETPVPSPTPTPFVPRGVIKIASQSPLSGNQEIFGEDIRRGAALAVLQLSGSLEKQGYQVR